MVKKLLKYADDYAAQSTWKDFARLKFCLMAIGVMLGMNISKKHRKPVLIVAAITFVATYIPLMMKFLQIIIDGEFKFIRDES